MLEAERTIIELIKFTLAEQYGATLDSMDERQPNHFIKAIKVVTNRMLKI